MFLTKTKLKIAIGIVLAGSIIGGVSYFKGDIPIVPVVPEDSVQLLLINQNTLRPHINNIGDIVGVFDADHEFSPAEKEAFDIVTIKGINREQAETFLASLLPDTSTLTEDQVRTQYTQPKYKFKVIDKTKSTLREVFTTNQIKK